MVVVTTYTQRDFDLLVALGMPDTQAPSNFHYFDDEETEAVIEFFVPIRIADAYTEIKVIIAQTLMLCKAFPKPIRYHEDIFNDDDDCYDFHGTQDLESEA